MKDPLMKYQSLKLTLSLVLSLTILIGCSRTPGSDKQRRDVSITITQGGTPVTAGLVNLENPQTGEGGGGSLTEEGIVTIPNVALGKYSVTILPPEMDPVPPEPGQAPAPPKATVAIPEKFSNGQSSPLELEVTEEAGEFTFDLKDAS